MKKLVIAAFLATLSAAGLSFAEDATPSGLDVMTRVQDRYVGDDFKALMEMKIISGSGNEKVREMIFIGKDYGDDSKSLIKFVSPKALKDSGLLIHSFADEDNLQWLYLSRAGKREPRKIPATEKDDSFIGSEFYYVDFEENQAKDFEHKLVGEEALDGKPSYVVESVPKDSSYPYSRLVTWVDKATDVAMKTDIYMDGTLLKTITVLKLEEHDGILTAMETVAENHRNGKKSIMNLKKIKYNNKVGDDVFTVSQLTKEL